MGRLALGDDGQVALRNKSGICAESVERGLAESRSPIARSARLRRAGGRTSPALAERTNGVGTSVAGGSARFFRATGVAAADRATLVWQRRGTGCYQAGCYPSAMTLTNLDLQQVDPAS